MKVSSLLMSICPLTKACDAQKENRNGSTQGKIALLVDAANANK